YGRLRGWAPEDFRATLQGYFLPTGLFIALGHGAAGLWTAEVLRLFLYNLPVALLAIFLGGYINRAIPPGKFDRAVHLALVFMGAMLIVNSIS
ncbi:MAG: sulfite exporter TauE/SafE family protein, partial [Calditrichaeota bacterium]|nr:sulfite exporter TauE/SafE family protein [Calditrichota bacterium]